MRILILAMMACCLCTTMSFADQYSIGHTGAVQVRSADLIGVRLLSDMGSPTTGASAVVRQFYTLYMHKQDLAPERGLLDDRLYWLLKQASSDHPGYKFHGIGERYGDSDPFGLGQNAQFYKSFTLGTPIAQRNAVVVPVLLSPTSGQHLTAIVKDEGGTYKIYDISEGSGTLRQELEGYARNPNCHWPKSGRG